MRYLAAAFVCAVLWSCHARDPGLSDTLHRGLGGEPATLDPGAAADSFSYQVIQDLFEGLTAEGPNGEAIPAAASSWEVDASGTTYTFHIRADGKWSDGTPLLAKQFIEAWQRVLDPKFASPAADNLSLIAGARRIMASTATPDELDVHSLDERTLVIKLERPAPYFPGLLSHTSAFPIYSKNGNPARNSEKLISNGPYVLSSWQPGTGIQLSRNEHYWNLDHVRIAKVEYQFTGDENAQFARYRAGQLDMTDVVPRSALSAIKREIPSELVVAPYLGTAYYALNLRSDVFSTSRELRQSLSMAIDRKKLVAAMGFGQSAAYGFVPPSIWNYQSQYPDWAGLDDQSRILEARRLYSVAGYSQSKPLHVRVLFSSNSTIKQAAVQIASMWKEALGVETEFEEEEYRVFLETRHDPTRYEIARLAWVADFNDAASFLDTFRRNSVNNDEGYSNKDFDALMDLSASTEDIAERREFMQLAERLMVTGYPVIPLYYYVSKRLVKPYLHGVAPSPLDRVPSKDISFISAN